MGPLEAGAQAVRSCCIDQRLDSPEGPVKWDCGFTMHKGCSAKTPQKPVWDLTQQVHITPDCDNVH